MSEMKSSTEIEYRQVSGFPGYRVGSPIIRKRAALGESNASIGRHYHVTKEAIWSIVHRKSWAHIS